MPAWAPLLETYSGAGSGFLRFDFFGMGTQNVFLVAGASEAILRRAVQEGMQLLDRLEQRLSKFLPDSDVTLVNELGAHSPVHVSSDLFNVLEKAHQACHYTDGAFDPTVGPLLDAWGFVNQDWRVPADSEIERLLELRGMHHVKLNSAAQTVHLRRPGVTIDLGAIGKGYAADRLAESLRGHGVTTGAVICGRSTVVTWGTPPGEDNWSFDVVHPLRPQSSLLTLAVEPGALSSSGAYEKCFHHGAHEYGHVFDPRTGRPTCSPMKGVTVWTRSAMLGDVLSTALFVRGREALSSSEKLAQLATRWEGDDARTGFLLVEAAPNNAEGVAWSTHFFGAPPFVETRL